MSLAQLSRLLPLPEPDLQQVLDYASTLSKPAAAEHFTNLLGETPQSIEFISSFNSRRQGPATSVASSDPLESTSDGVPKPKRTPKKKKASLHTPPPRQVEDANYAAQGTAYLKKDEQDYMSKRPASMLALNPHPATVSTPAPAPAPAPAPTPAPKHRAPPAAGHLISDIPSPKSKSTPTSRTASPAPKTKVTIAGGPAMHGASTSLSELDSAIRALELSTSPSKHDDARRACNCIATRHPLLAAAPNCLNCGKVICAKEGLGPCTFCGTPLLSSADVQAMIRELKDERGRERMAADASAHRRAEVSKVPAPFSNPRGGGPTPGEAGLGLSAAEIKAKEHRDRLLGFQAQNAKRTTVRDEAADWETPDVGTGMWSSPAERARQLKKQQKVLREMEWNARPEYEKRRQVVSIDLVGRKVVKRMGAVERPVEVDDEEPEEEEERNVVERGGNEGGGTFSHNPLLGGLIKPHYDAGKGKGVDLSGGEREKPTWRRVQDDYEDNEGLILDGGVYGGEDTHAPIRR